MIRHGLQQMGVRSLVFFSLRRARFVAALSLQHHLLNDHGTKLSVYVLHVSLQFLEDFRLQILRNGLDCFLNRRIDERFRSFL